MFSYPNPTVIKTQIVETPAEAAWKVVIQFDRIAEFTPSFLESASVVGEGEGAERTCVAPNNQGSFKEKITHFNEKERYYRYAVVEGVPTQNMENSFRIVPLGETKSLIIWTSGYEFMETPHMSAEQFHGFLDASVGEYLSGAARAAENEA